MKNLLRIVGGLLFLVVLVPAALVGVFFVTFDEKTFRAEMAQQVKVATGREVAFDGPIGFSFDNGASITLKDVSVMNPEGFKEKMFLNIGQLNVAVNLSALAQRRIEVRNVELTKAQINLVTSAGGKNGWDFTPVKAAKSAKMEPAAGTTETAQDDVVDAAFKKAAEEAKATFRIEKVSVSSIAISHANVNVVDERSGKTQKVSIGKARLQAPAEGPFHVDMLGLYEEKAFDVKLDAPKGALALASGKATPIDAQVEYAGSRYEVKAQLSRSDNFFELKDMKVRVRDMDVAGNIALRTGGAVPKVTGNLEFQDINLPELMPASVPAAPKTTTRASHLVLVAATPLRATLIAAGLPDLRGLDADLNIKAARLILGEGRVLENVRAKLDLNGGRLRLAPILANFLGVPYEATMDYTPSGNSAATRLGLKASGVDFVKLAEALGSKSPLNAKGDLFMDVTGNGLSLKSFRNTLRGRVELLVGKGGVDLSGGGSTAVNLIKMLYPKTQVSEKENLNCAAMRFNVDNGVMKTDGLLFDSNLAAIAGEGTIDLARDNVNLLFRHAVKDNQAGGFLNVPIRAMGTLANLSYGPDEKAVVERAAAVLTGGGAVSTGVPKVDLSVQGQNACLAALKNPQPIMLQQMKPQEAVKATVQQATDAYKGARDKIKGLLKGGAPTGSTETAPAGDQPANDPVGAIKGLLGR